MQTDILFYINSILFGVGLAMDAFSVSLANGMNEPFLRRKKSCLIAGTFGFFQALMPMLGWVCIHNVVRCFAQLERIIPWIALLLLLYIGGKMLLAGICGKTTAHETGLAPGALLLQGIATSIDAFSVGFTISDLTWKMALLEALIIAVVTFFISYAGLLLGKRFGTRFSGQAEFLGGVILILIGLEIFIKGIFF